MIYTKVDDKEKKNFWDLIEKADQIVITGHISPDEDSIASVLAVKLILEERFAKRRKKIRIVYTGDYAERWKKIKGYEEIEFVEDLADYLAGADVLIMLDGGNYDRFSLKPRTLKKLVKSGRKSICIDHHASKPDKFDFAYILTSLSSTAEGVYDLMVEKNKKVGRRLAELLLMGILGDTGNIRYVNPRNALVLKKIERLVVQGKIDIQTLQAEYEAYPKRIFEAVRQMMGESLFYEKVGNWPSFQVGLIRELVIKKYELSDEEVALVSHLYTDSYLRRLEGFEWGFVLSMRDDGSCRISFRSLPRSVNVRKIAEAFSGGGHNNSSGAEIRRQGRKIEIEEALEKVLAWLRENKPVFD